MIRGYADQSANERTFLAWVRTGIAVTAFGLLVEKFELFSGARTVTPTPDPAIFPPTALVRVIERYDGLALAVLYASGESRLVGGIESVRSELVN
jgi:putative membrane protein